MLEVNGQFYKEVRCTACRALLAYEYIFSGRLMIKCPRCNELNTIRYKTTKTAMKAIDGKENPDNEIVLTREAKGGEKI